MFTIDVDDDTAEILKELSGLESEYYTFGLHLGLSPGKVKEIQVNHPHNSRAAFADVITEWLKMNYQYNKGGRRRPSWQLLTEATSVVDLEKAQKISSNHRKVYYTCINTSLCEDDHA